MVIDLILDRKYGEKYNAKKFYNSCANYGQVAYEITEAMDEGGEEEVKKSIQRYIIDNGYNLDIIKYIGLVKWL